VNPTGPGARATLRPGDVIESIGNMPIDTAKAFKAIISRAEIGANLPIKIIRNGRIYTFNISIREQSNSLDPQLTKAGQAAPSFTPHFKNFGLTVQDLPADFALLFGIPVSAGALVIDVELGSPAYDAGFSKGDIILQENKLDIKGSLDFIRAMQKFKHNDLNVFYVQRGPDEKIFIPLQSPAS